MKTVTSVVEDPRYIAVKGCEELQCTPIGQQHSGNPEARVWLHRSEKTQYLLIFATGTQRHSRCRRTCKSHRLSRNNFVPKVPRGKTEPSVS